MGKNKICVVIPIYKETLSDAERFSIRTTFEHLKDYDIYFVTHRQLDLSCYRKYGGARVHYFPEKFFKSEQTYSRLLLSPFFYLKFIKYKYLCIVQSDAIILGTGDRLMQFADLGYDYFGAPWKQPLCIHRLEPDDHYQILEWFPTLKKKIMGDGSWCWVGNGGLSLRNVRNTEKLLFRHWFSRRTWYKNEDLFFSYFGLCEGEKYQAAPGDIARRFAQETTAKIDKNKGIRPFGVHAWEKHYPGMLQEMHN